KPLPKDGQWARLPKLKTRSYTLRQLYDGYVYVFDETAGTLHEYAASASDGHLSQPPAHRLFCPAMDVANVRAHALPRPKPRVVDEGAGPGQLLP
ncbi:membrane protein, partial [Pseudomonas syringae pv. actinidiae ICMP 19095]